MGEILLVLSDECFLHFHSMKITDENGNNIEFETDHRVTMYRDLFWIGSERVKLSYVTHPTDLVFDKAETDGLPLYAENAGSYAVTIHLLGQSFTLEPGERKEIIKRKQE